MANIKVTELNEAASIKDEDIIMVVQDGVNKKIPKRLLNEVIISPTEPTTNERVWLKKGKNLFNKNAFSSYVWFNSDGSTYSTNDNHIISEYIEVKPNTQYTFSINVDAFISIRGYDKNKNQTETYIDSTARTITFRTNENTFFVKVGIGNGLNYINNDIQLEPGEVVTSYEEYVEPAIYCKNNNGVFEEFANLSNKYKLLWKNPKPNEAFGGTAWLELSSSDYDLLIWFYKRDKDSDYVDSTIIPKGYGGCLGYVNTYGTQNNAFREVARHSDTNFEISFAFKGGYDAADDNIIPIQVLGVKF